MDTELCELSAGVHFGAVEMIMYCVFPEARRKHFKSYSKGMISAQGKHVLLI